MSPRRARRQSAIENDERILDAALASAAAAGLDALTVSGVAKAAGFTSGAMYSRYEYREELFADLWERRCATPLHEVLQAVVTHRRSPASAVHRDELVRLATEPTPQLQVAVEMCLIAHRVPELNEIIPNRVLGWLDEAGLAGGPLDPEQSVVVALLSAALGSVVLTPFARELLPDFARIVVAGELPTQPPHGPRPAPRAEIQQLVFEREDSIRNDLLRAAQAVLARSGVQRATLTRIGRVAGLAPATVYGHYDSRDELIADILRIAQVSNYDVDVRISSLGDVDAMAAALSGWLQPEAVVRRRVNQETLIAAWHHRKIGAVYVEEELRAFDRVVENFPGGIVPTEALRFVQEASLLAINGSAVLAEVMPSMAALDWRPALDLVLRSILSPD